MIEYSELSMLGQKAGVNQSFLSNVLLAKFTSCQLIELRRNVSDENIQSHVLHASKCIDETEQQQIEDEQSPFAAVEQNRVETVSINICKLRKFRIIFRLISVYLTSLACFC